LSRMGLAREDLSTIRATDANITAAG